MSVYTVLLKARELGYQIASLRGECDFAELECAKTKEAEPGKKTVSAVKKLCDDLLLSYEKGAKDIWMR